MSSEITRRACFIHMFFEEPYVMAYWSRALQNGGIPKTAPVFSTVALLNGNKMTMVGIGYERTI